MEMSGQPHISAAFFPGKEVFYSLNRRLGGPQSLSGNFIKRKNILPLPGVKLRFQGYSVRGLVTRLTTLSWLLIVSGKLFIYSYYQAVSDIEVTTWELG
jgi:hypothetical protein